MSEPLEILSPVVTPQVPARVRRRAVLALLVACLAWGGSFTWAKAVMAGINHRAGLADTHTLGVLLLLGWRFLIAGVVWIVVFPGARSGWTMKSVGRSLALGLPFTVAMIAQQMGLTRTTEAVNAFLTSLAVLFVPLMTAAWSRRLPNPTIWAGVALAVAGIWLMTGGAPTGFGVGEALGVACSILFSIHIIMVNAVMARDGPARMAGGQFLVTGVAAILLSLIMEPATRRMDVFMLPFSSGLRMDFAMLLVFATLLAFGLMIFFQPKVEPTRAALVYLTEPVFAAIFAWLVRGQTLAVPQIAGAALIITANSLVEWLGARSKASESAVSTPLEARI